MGAVFPPILRKVDKRCVLLVSSRGQHSLIQLHSKLCRWVHTQADQPLVIQAIRLYIVVRVGGIMDRR
jgi:hypothetical protein